MVYSGPPLSRYVFISFHNKNKLVGFGQISKTGKSCT